MLKSRPLNSEIHSDEDEWSERCDYWLSYQPPRVGAKKKYHFREPLILSGHGINIRVDHATLLIRNGFTHYPQKQEQIRFFPGDPNLPDRIIILDASGGISLDALYWMAEQKIEFLQLDWRGRTVMLGGNSGYSARPELVEAQRRAKCGRQHVEIARWLIQEKVAASIATIKAVIPDTENRRTGISRLEKSFSEIVRPKKSISEIVGIEGNAAAAYFNAWSGVPLKWSGLKSRPIPDSWMEVGPRKMGWRKSGQNARHPINAMLNYGYGILVGKVRSEIAAAGLDPLIGILHGNSQNRMPLVYDLMEPLRPIVDSQILEFSLRSTFRPGDFTINKFGGCRLNPQLAQATIAAVDRGVTPEKTRPMVAAFTGALAQVSNLASR